MKVLLIAALFIGASSAFQLNEFLNGEWESFKTGFGKAYSNLGEELERRQVFESNHAFISKHNFLFATGQKSYTVKMNQFGDMTAAEVAAMLNGYKMGNRTGTPFEFDESLEAPKTVDWRKKGYVTPIKDQGQCGSCWAFSTTGSLEGQHFKKVGHLVSLSEQNLVDCSQAEGNNGCNGGLMDDAFDYILKNKGIDTETSYPYTAQDGTCKFRRSAVGATLKSHTDIPVGNEKALTSAVATVGPISVAIDASQSSFQFYHSGVYDEPECSSTQLDHGVLAVGYGTLGGKDYYIVKNSWGTEWGLNGFILMSRNQNNQCGIATSASYPTV